MNRKALQILVLTAALGMLSSALAAQNPPPKKPPAPPERHAPPPPPPPTGAAGSGPPCHGSDVAQYLQSPKTLMTTCLHRMVQLGTDTNDYTVMSVTDAGFVLARSEAGNERNGSPVMTKFVPWSAVLYYNMMPEFVQVALVRQ